MDHVHLNLAIRARTGLCSRALILRQRNRAGQNSQRTARYNLQKNFFEQGPIHDLPLLRLNSEQNQNTEAFRVSQWPRPPAGRVG
jgi:hypothetical protein